MLLQTNSYVVPKDKRAEHARVMRRFRQTLKRLGCDHFEVYEQVGPNWGNAEASGRYVQILRFVDRKHQLSVQQAERVDPVAQAVISDFCDLINFTYQQQQGLFAVGYYTSVLPVAPKRGARGEVISTVEHEVIDDPEAELPEAPAAPAAVAEPPPMPTPQPEAVSYAPVDLDDEEPELDALPPELAMHARPIPEEEDDALDVALIDDARDISGVFVDGEVIESSNGKGGAPHAHSGDAHRAEHPHDAGHSHGMDETALR